ncbi:hypothetical protein [Novosphingobium olei]|uniref:FecR N-terminal domain-containing protein n=1 Tax=Novosphingobium olei TaxID=2728851 RepID=A0A7Y0BP55_9SPHN|nr:hypothetical protein [Novosphingobium olei]NML93977.1 hypothetical protein [Novosphingobium olei]
MAQLKPQESRTAAEIAVDFMILHVEGRLDEAGEVELIRWFEQDPSHQRLFQNAMISWWDLENQGLQPEIAELRAEALQAYGRASQQRWRRFRRPLRRAWLVGAVALGLAVAGLAAVLLRLAG